MKIHQAPPPSELSIHRTVAGYLGNFLASPAWFTTFPAGGGGAMRGRILRGAGLKPGVPDMLIVFRGLCHWIELKNERGTVRPIQRDCHLALSDAGCRIAVCRSLEDVKAALDDWSIPLRPHKLSTQRFLDATAHLRELAGSA